MLALLALVCAPAQAASPAPAPSPVYQPQVVNPELVGGRRVDSGGTSTFLVWGSDATILRSMDGRDWQHAQTPGASDLAQMAANPQGSVLVAVGAQGTILRSTDAGKSWRRARNTIVDTDLLAVVHVYDRIWIAAGTQGRILRSKDDARTWTLVNSHLKVAMRSLSLDAYSGRILIGGDDGLVGFSIDAGVSWQITALTMPDPATPVSGFHRFGRLLLATSALGRFLTSEDNGDSWDLMQSSSQAYFTDAVMDADHGVIVMTGHNGDLLRSPDGGRSWEGNEILVDGRKNFLTAIRHDSRGHALLAVGQGGSVARSTDGGVSWVSASKDLRGELRGLLQDTNGTFIVFGGGGLLASSTDSGARWAIARQPLDFPLREIIVTPRDSLVATSRLGDVLRSTDAGASWQLVTPNYPNANTPPDLRGLVIAPSQEALIAVGPPGAILRGSADGSSWKVAVWTDIEAERAFPWVLTDRQRKLIVAVEARGGLMVSRDDGASWQRSDLPETIQPGKVPFWQGSVLESRGVLLVAGEGGRAARSTDAGATWSMLNTGSSANLYGSHADEDSGELFLMGSQGTLLRSPDLGLTWTAITTGSDQELRRMYRDPRSRALLCYGAHGTVLRSQDGETWRVVESHSDGVLREVMQEPGSNHLLMVGGQGTLLRSSDGGRKWQKLETHTSRHFSGMVADPHSGDLVLVGERIVRLVRQSPLQRPTSPPRQQ
jgi:photosystem II stability/assembly factor-like uncharacterized protein